MSGRNTVTFGKFDGLARTGNTASADIIKNGERIGWIETSIGSRDEGITGKVYFVDAYVVEFFDGNERDRVFESREYGSSRAALSAAKKYVREIC